MSTYLNKASTFVLFLILLISLVSTQRSALADAQNHLQQSKKIDPQVQAAVNRAQPGEMLTTIVTMREQADLSQIPGVSRATRQKGVIRALQAKADASQKQIISYLSAQEAMGNVSAFTSMWIFNGLSVTATADVINELASRDDVLKITPDETDIVSTNPLALNSPETNLSVVKAPDLWNIGLTGQGVVLANMDSGVDVYHPDLTARYRGGVNSWFDPYGQHSSPFDASGHGTHTMGVMVGGDAGGTNIGLAPDAQWIAVKIFNDSGSATATAIHLGYQWLLDPDGNLNTPDAPHVVNNSWSYGSPGCNLEFQLDLAALRAAGILPVFSAGNYGPGPSTSVSPANNPEAFAVGGTDNFGQMYALSSRGPSACGQATSVYPELVAPGVNIQTADLFGFYTSVSGTSLSAPHVSGGLALLLSAFPDLSTSQQESALINNAIDLGSPGPDNDFGFGSLDLLAAYQWLLAGGGDPTPTPSPTPDPNINLAFNRPVMVSSAQDSAHQGNMAVDEDLGTYWQTARAKGKNKLTSEWISVDLGSSVSIGKVVLEWNDNFATEYTIQVSEDNSNWSILAAESNGNGSNDTLTFASSFARYVRMESTAWSSGSLRAWLNEFQVFAGGSDPTPTPTPTPPPGGGTTMHVGDLDGDSTPKRKNWTAIISILVHDADESPLSGITVSGTWSSGASGSDSCVSDQNGLCTISKNNLKSSVPSVAFTLDDLYHSTYTYNPSDNHDPEGEGLTLIIQKP